MIERPDISVVIAAYNVDNYITHAIESALNQSGLSLEVIVIDDASTDQTAERVKRFSDPRVRLIQLTDNIGPGAARNLGFESASAPWIAVLDGDDAFGLSRLKDCLELAQSTNADIIVDNLLVKNEATGAQYPMFNAADFNNTTDLDLTQFIKGNIFLLSRRPSLGYVKPVFSAKFLKQHHIHYNTSLRIGEDYMLLLEALAHGAKCKVLSKPGYFYTVRKGSTSHRLALADIISMQKADCHFTAKYMLPKAALRAQKWRSFSISEAYYFTRLVEAILNKRFFHALHIILKRPTSLVHLWRPLWVRIERFTTQKSENAL